MTQALWRGTVRHARSCDGSSERGAQESEPTKESEYHFRSRRLDGLTEQGKYDRVTAIEHVYTEARGATYPDGAWRYEQGVT